MIPKIIHYCWFGGKEKPEEVMRMIESWKRFCPDFQIKEWNESRFKVTFNRYCEEAYGQQKWAFVSDVARLWALVHEGGIYMDTDVEVVRPLDGLLEEKAFLGFEGTEWIATNIMGCEAGNAFFKDFLASYDLRKFIHADGSLDQTTNVEELTRRLYETYRIRRDGTLQQAGEFTLYPTDYFCPYDYIDGRMRTTENTYTIHWYAQTWIKRNKWKTWASQWLHRLTGTKMK